MPRSKDKFPAEPDGQSSVEKPAKAGGKAGGKTKSKRARKAGNEAASPGCVVTFATDLLPEPKKDVHKKSLRAGIETAQKTIERAGGHGRITATIHRGEVCLVHVEPLKSSPGHPMDGAPMGQTAKLDHAAQILAGADMVSADVLATKLGISRTSVNAKRQKHILLGLEGARRGYRFPIWQCDKKTGKPFAVIPRLLDILGDAWTVHGFLMRAHPALGGLSGRDALGRDLDHQLVEAAAAEAGKLP